MPVDVSSLQRVLMDRLQEQVVSPPGQQQANPQQISQFQNELGADPGTKNADATQPVAAGDSGNAVNLQTVQSQELTPGDRILANMSSPSANGIDARQVTPAANVPGDNASSLVHTQMAMNEATLNSSIGINSLSSTSQGFESLLRSS